jgi:hypothetical protein
VREQKEYVDSDDQRVNWANFRSEVLLKDYEMRFLSGERKLERINTMRQWEITLLAVILTFALSQSIAASTIYLVFGILILFALLELAITASWRLTKTRMIEAEELFVKSRSIDEVWNKYKFYTSLILSTRLRDKVRAVFLAFDSLQFWAWHLSLSTLFIILFRLL